LHLQLVERFRPRSAEAPIRIVVCGAACYLAYRECRRASGVTGWSVLLVLIAILFNPVIEIHLSRQTWAPIDFGVAVALIVHWWTTRKRSAN
jgi:hypothetical protein